MTSFEAWCPHCRVSWPPETRYCVHCGGRVAPSRELAEGGMRGSFAAGEGADPRAEAEATVQRSAVRPLRIGIAVLWLVLALAGSILRHCAQS